MAGAFGVEHHLGWCATMQAVTRVNVEQAPRTPDDVYICIDAARKRLGSGVGVDESGDGLPPPAPWIGPEPR